MGGQTCATAHVSPPGWRVTARGTAVARSPRVPSFAHEIYVELFRQRPALAGELLAAWAGIRLGGATAELASIDLSQVAPAEYRSDAVSVLRDRRRAAVAAVIPRVTDAAQARAAPQLAVLSALAHPEARVAEAALAGFDALPEGDQKLYWDVIVNGLPGLVRQALEARMIKGYQYQSDFARKYYWQGHDEGQKQTLAEHRRELVELVGARLPGIREELETRLRDKPLTVLVRISVELGRARSEKAVRTILDRFFGRSA